MRISDWSSDVCSSDLPREFRHPSVGGVAPTYSLRRRAITNPSTTTAATATKSSHVGQRRGCGCTGCASDSTAVGVAVVSRSVHLPSRSSSRSASGGSLKARQVMRRSRSEEHTSELQSLMRISYAVFCLKKKKQTKKTHNQRT